MYFLGVDCGATNLRVGIVDDKGQVLSLEMKPSPLRDESENFGQEVKDLTKRLLLSSKLLEADIEAIGIGTPGPIDSKQGLILISSNLENSKPINLRHQLELHFNCKLYFDIDTHVALRGEAWMGAAKDSKNVVMLTLGSGVGGAVMDNGQIEQGSSGLAGEIGHNYIAIDKQGNLPICGLGHRGCLEAFVRHAKDLNELGYFLGIALANIADTFNPQKIIIGGGMIKQGDFLPKAIEVMKDEGMHPAVDQVIVQYSELGDLAGVIGAAKLAIDSSNG